MAETGPSWHRQDLGIDRFWREVSMVPEIDGHAWANIVAYDVRELVSLEHQLKFDITALMADRAALRGSRDSVWIKRSGAALGVKQKQLVGVRTMRRIRQPLERHPPQERGANSVRVLEHLARMVRLWRELDPGDDADLIWSEVLDTLDRIVETQPVEPTVVLDRIRERRAREGA
jgi:hypothetical protein